MIPELKKTNPESISFLYDNNLISKQYKYHCMEFYREIYNIIDSFRVDENGYYITFFNAIIEYHIQQNF